MLPERVRNRRTAEPAPIVRKEHSSGAGSAATFQGGAAYPQKCWRVHAIHQQEEWRDAVRALRSEIEPHAREEEETEFPRLRELLDQAGNTELSRKIRQEESLVV